MNKDEVFSAGNFTPGSFKFNDEVATVFDDMATRCIPYYHEVIHLTAQAAAKFVPDSGKIYDLGCSTGSTLIYLAKYLKDTKVNMTGYDPAPAMLTKAREKSNVFTYSHEINFDEGVCQTADISDANMVIMNYTLQFVDATKRNDVIKKIYDNLKPGGIFILSEKLREPTEEFESFNTETYENFKAGNGYSFLEIANKRQALENILVPQSTEDNVSMLTRAGFSKVDILFKWLNFATFIAIK
ncbi:MAG: carboxy-S-adenosyl-L-methionine synthase CmoA [Lentisphaeraceae bacterium]|nr:carboxy-S-adenosyl-L-methionine synthase CmoA [Lentisphaeraceae bacterium]